MCVALLLQRVFPSYVILQHPSRHGSMSLNTHLVRCLPLLCARIKLVECLLELFTFVLLLYSSVILTSEQCLLILFTELTDWS